MIIISSPQELQQWRRTQRGSVGFVPTMGALHLGHIALIEAARERNDAVVVSIFVNPTQFLEGEDLDRYPRKYEADERICKLGGVDVLFFPSAEAMYGQDEVRLCAPEVRGYVLEGASRPGHFDGVLTVVMKLFHLVRPDQAYFGKKDAQQLSLITQMVRDMFMEIEIVPIDTVREKEGLALSSRNVYLSFQEREEALKLSRALKRCAKLMIQGERRCDVIESEMRTVCAPLHVGYIAFVNRAFEPITQLVPQNSIVLISANVGSTHLIDNIWL
ncbi:MAG: pantoate--beta-alanine ligase [Campylobacterales bacterium]|nr:pantoate--beta-alanine ligase [Campylobacterales bacterium]